MNSYPTYKDHVTHAQLDFLEHRNLKYTSKVMPY